MFFRLFKDGYTEQLKVYILNLLTYEKEHHLQVRNKFIEHTQLVRKSCVIQIKKRKFLK